MEKVSRDINSKLVTLKSLSTTRWACRSEAAIKSNYSILIQAIEEIKNSTRTPKIKAKAKGLLIEIKSFKFLFALNMLHPILLSIAKVSSKLQTEKLDLLTAVDLITGLKNTLSEFRSNDNDFEVVYNDTLKVCAEFNIEIPEVRKRKISCRVDPSKNGHIIESKKEEIKYSCYFVTLDDMLSSLNSRFNQETLDLISAVGNLINRTSTENDYAYLFKTFNINIDELKSEIRLLKNIPNTEMLKDSSTRTITQWLRWLGQSKEIFLIISIK